MNEGAGDLITYDELIDAVELDDVDSDIRTAANFLIDALADWPVDDFNQPVNLLLSLYEEVGAPLNYNNLSDYKDRVAASKNEDSIWKGSSVSCLLELFDVHRTGTPDKTIILNDLIFTISNHYLNR
jgi:hypothetical protein